MTTHALNTESTSKEKQHHTGDHFSLNSSLGPGNPVWCAFSSGMCMMLRHADRFETKTYEITRSNLRLLHHTLLRDPAYRTLLKSSELETGMGVIEKTLLSLNNINAKLVTVSRGNRISLDTDDYSLGIALLISGNAIFNRANNKTGRMNGLERHTKWSLGSLASHSMGEDTNIVSAGNIILHSMNGGTVSVPETFNEVCIFLYIQLDIDKPIPDL